MHRYVLADLTLPLERNRLMALIFRLADRARVTGREIVQRPLGLPEVPPRL